MVEVCHESYHDKLIDLDPDPRHVHRVDFRVTGNWGVIIGCSLKTPAGVIIHKELFNNVYGKHGEPVYEGCTVKVYLRELNNLFRLVPQEEV